MNENKDWSEPRLIAITVGLVLITQGFLFLYQSGLDMPILVSVTFIAGTVLILVGYGVPLEEIEKEFQEEELKLDEKIKDAPIQNECDLNKNVEANNKQNIFSEYQSLSQDGQIPQPHKDLQQMQPQTSTCKCEEIDHQNEKIQIQTDLELPSERVINELESNLKNRQTNSVVSEPSDLPIQELPPQKVSATAKESLAQESLAQESRTETSYVQELIQKTEEQELPWYVRLHRGLQKTRNSFFRKVKDILFGKPKLDKIILEELEAILYEADVGVKTSQEMLNFLQNELENNPDLSQAGSEKLILLLKEKLGQRLKKYSNELVFNSTGLTVWLVVGVNGVGKTTTIAKLAKRYIDNGKKVILAAGDTFRAAAIDQLCIWGERVGAEVIRSHEGGDPGAIVFDSIHAAKKRNADLLIVDTAGRMHVKTNLMDELKKVRKIIEKESNGPHETLLVLDATTGQNAIQQAKMFNEALNITGIIMTKLDGTAKGGVIFAVEDEIKVPIKFIGIGEKFTDLLEFCPDSFLDALFEDDEKINVQTQ